MTNNIFWCFSSAENVSKSDWSSAPSWTDMFILCLQITFSNGLCALTVNESTQLIGLLTVNISTVCFCRSVISTQSIMKVHVKWVGRGNITCIWAMCLKKIQIQTYIKSLVMGLILPHGTRGQNQLVLVSNGSLSVLLCFGFWCNVHPMSSPWS